MTDTPQDRAYPIFVAGYTGAGARAKLQSNPRAGSRRQGRGVQGPRLQPQMDALALLRAGATPSTQARPGDNELVLVWELRSSVDKLRATLKHLEGLEVLSDALVLPDELQDFSSSDDYDDQEILDGDTVYVLANSPEASDSILGLWHEWISSDKPNFARGLAPWKDVFALLKSVRPWSASDRAPDDQRRIWQQGLDAGQTQFRLSVELWSRASTTRRLADRAEVKATIGALGATVVSEVTIPEIAYSGLLVDFTREQMQDIVSLRSDVLDLASVAHLRAQSLARDSLDSEPTPSDLAPADHDDERPALVALLDAIPDLNHPLLSGSLILEDAPVIAGGDMTSPREHGTSMASAVIYGDLIHGSPNALQRRVRVVPILTWQIAGDEAADAMALDQLPTSVLHAALQQLFPAGDEVSWPRVVVLAVGAEPAKRASQPSSLARLLDYWAASHNVLFIVSAGNHPDELVTLPPTVTDEDLRDPRLSSELIDKHVVSLRRNAGILAPADSTNALTVGAANAATLPAAEIVGEAIDLLAGALSPSLTSRTGATSGTRFLKPEIMVGTGRALYRRDITQADKRIYEPVRSGPSLEGVVTASSGPEPTVKSQGTSLAAALIGHRAGRIMEILSSGPGDVALVRPRELAVATKALLVNAASWSGAEDYLGGIEENATRSQRRALATKVLGYGTVDEGRVAIGAKQRVSVLITGFLNEEGSRSFAFPLPASLSGQAEWRRIGITLAWMTPTNNTHQQYRRSRLWFQLDDRQGLRVSRQEANHHAVRRGTLQHEVFDGTDAIVVTPGDTFDVSVHYAGAAGGGAGSVHYGLVITFEVGPDSAVAVYDEVTAQLLGRQGARAAQPLIEVRVEG